MVDLAPGAEHDPLARLFVELIRGASERDGQRADLTRMRGAVGVVADDAGTALTLRFDFGRVTVHEGLVGVPTITIRGASDDIAALAELPFGALGLPDATSSVGRGVLRQLVGALGHAASQDLWARRASPPGAALAARALQGHPRLAGLFAGF